MNVYRISRPAALVSGLAASLAFALTGLAAPAYAAVEPVVAADPPSHSKGDDCDDDKRSGSGYCHDSKGRISYELQSRTIEKTFTVPGGQTHNGSVACDSGWLIDSGGVALSIPQLILQKSIKGVSESWETTVVNRDMAAHTYDVAIVCSRLVAVQH
ncbi:MULTISPECIES: hypothetical protein [unclassified Streptomyces]|uniref:hypothetical protein n=1 Tax=unclassified Streptomyces TaxID=2593676 RepID=UPI000DC7730C|nr:MULTISPECIES: hypothetical protein [unclassified Streptomyces]AWZ05695.1 hypothetical protein DRB89_14700 [Streptomyces sp. ICC4]AWZ11944.1 hypothetical protein DRB96_06025 [Streptomyces sp. ICC1]